MDWIADQNNELARILAVDMQDLDSIRHAYETQAQDFSRQHDMAVTVMLACAIILKLSGVLWMSVLVILTGVAIIAVLRTRKLAAERRISQIDREIRQKSLEFLSNSARGQD
jgi:diacylglycerol kinase